MRLIAFYLPQFHSIPQNDAWWGEGYTEWTAVTKAQPLFRHHQQPEVPAHLGYYDLRLPEARRAQAELAREYGIYGFCYYHYWFEGRRLLELPFNEVLDSGQPDFPFCLCWANHSWTRRWIVGDNEVLQPQGYSEADDVAHITWLLRALRDPRAIKIEDKPIFLVYRAWDLPDPAQTTQTWRREAARAGLNGIYLIAVETDLDYGWDATREGFDAKVLFQPRFSMLNRMPRLPIGENGNLQVYDYQIAWPVLANPEPVSYRRYDCVIPGWDNSPRIGDAGVILHNSTPDAYVHWLQCAIAKTLNQPQDHRIVFLNAWNEWGEGAHLEPDTRHGLAYLEATRRALMSRVDPRHQDSTPLSQPRSLDEDSTRHADSTGEGGKEVLFAEGAAGVTQAPWIHMGKTYTFRLYAGPERTSLLASIDVMPSFQSKSNRGKRRESPFLTATPNPVPANVGASTTIAWSTGNGSAGEVYVSEDGAAEQVFATGVEGTCPASWIAADKTYEFRLYSATKRTSLIATLIVTTGDGAFLTATPNPVPTRPEFPGTTTIAWSTGDGALGQLYVSERPGMHCVPRPSPGGPRGSQ